MPWWCAPVAGVLGYLLGVKYGPWLVGWLNERGMEPGERPYTQAEVEAADCFRCGSPAAFQWQVCADANTYRPLCFACDVELNRRTLEWVGHPDQHRLMLEYITKQEV